MPRYGPYTFFLSSDREMDEALKAYFDNVRERGQNMSQAIRELCYKGLTGKGGGTLEDIQSRLDRIEQALSSGVVIGAQGAQDADKIDTAMTDAEESFDTMDY